MMEKSPNSKKRYITYDILPVVDIKVVKSLEKQQIQNGESISDFGRTNEEDKKDSWKNKVLSLKRDLLSSSPSCGEIFHGPTVRDVPNKKLKEISTDYISTFCAPADCMEFASKKQKNQNDADFNLLDEIKSWSLKTDFAYGMATSLYEKDPSTERLTGDPLADSLAVVASRNCAILALADGVSWGQKSKLASCCGIYGSISYLCKNLEKSVWTKDVFRCILRSFENAQKCIVEQEGTMTTLCVGVVVQLQEKDRFAFCVVNVGDSYAYHLSKKTNKVKEVTQGSHPIDELRDMRFSGGALGPADGYNPDLGNLTCSFVIIEKGDLVFLCSDGISDNFDPAVAKFTPRFKADEQTEVNAKITSRNNSVTNDSIVNPVLQNSSNKNSSNNSSYDIFDKKELFIEKTKIIEHQLSDNNENNSSSLLVQNSQIPSSFKLDDSNYKEKDSSFVSLTDGVNNADCNNDNKTLSDGSDLVLNTGNNHLHFNEVNKNTDCDPSHFNEVKQNIESNCLYLNEVNKNIKLEQCDRLDVSRSSSFADVYAASSNEEEDDHSDEEGTDVSTNETKKCISDHVNIAVDSPKDFSFVEFTGSPKLTNTNFSDSPSIQYSNPERRTTDSMNLQELNKNAQSCNCTKAVKQCDGTCEHLTEITTQNVYLENYEQGKDKTENIPKQPALKASSSADPISSKLICNDSQKNKLTSSSDTNLLPSDKRNLGAASDDTFQHAKAKSLSNSEISKKKKKKDELINRTVSEPTGRKEIYDIVDAGQISVQSLTPRERHNGSLEQMESVISALGYEPINGTNVHAVDVCAQIMNFVINRTAEKREILEEEPPTKLSTLSNKGRKEHNERVKKRLEGVPGKLDHASIVAYEVGIYGKEALKVDRIKSTGNLDHIPIKELPALKNLSLEAQRRASEPCEKKRYPVEFYENPKDRKHIFSAVH